MSDRHIVVYASPDAREAQRFQEHLRQVGIEAWVLGSPKEGSGAKERPLGNETQVAVAEGNAVVAQLIAAEFGKSQTGFQTSTVDILVDARPREVIEAWPTCPQCGKRRQTVCPVCETAGSDFPLADAIAGEGDEEHDHDSDFSEEVGDPLGRPRLVCPVCDEPFIPLYLRSCEWCNYDFGHGIEPPETVQEDIEAVNWRVGVVIGGLVAFAALVIWYMRVVLPQ